MTGAELIALETEGRLDIGGTEAALVGRDETQGELVVGGVRAEPINHRATKGELLS